jgi:translation initiation factor 3 subunit G
MEKGKSQGPDLQTTSVGENIVFRPSINWKTSQKDAEKEGDSKSMKEQLKDKKVKCRICNGEHFTARCPFKDTMAPIGEPGGAPAGDDEGPAGGSDAGGGGGGIGGAYIAPHLRRGAGAKAGESMGGGKYERDDLATLRVTNVSFLPQTCVSLQSGDSYTV